MSTAPTVYVFPTSFESCHLKDEYEEIPRSYLTIRGWKRNPICQFRSSNLCRRVFIVAQASRSCMARSLRRGNDLNHHFRTNIKGCGKTGSCWIARSKMSQSYSPENRISRNIVYEIVPIPPYHCYYTISNPHPNPHRILPSFGKGSNQCVYFNHETVCTTNSSKSLQGTVRFR